MDDLALLKDVADRTPLPSAADLDPARARLMAAITGAPTATNTATREPVRPRRRRLVVSAGIVVGLAAAITAVVSLGGLAPVGVDQPEASAAEILHQAADAVRELPATPPRPDQFIYTKTHRTYGSVRESWLSADGTHDGRISQEGEDIPLAGCRDGRMAVIKGDQPLPGVFESCTPSPAYRADLPTDAAGMRAYLSQDTGGEPGEPEDVSGLIRFTFGETYVPPASLAALFEAMADFPGLTVVDDAVDAAGRPGIGVRWTRHGYTETLVFDRKTHAFLGVTGMDAVVEQAIVDAVGERP